MTISSLLKELKLLCRDLHGLAVLFVMPIAFMLIMSLALSRDQDPHTDSRIALVGIANDSINTALAAALEKEQIHVTLMPSKKLTDAQNGLHDKHFQLVLHNPNSASGKIADDKALQIYVPPDTEPSWLAAVKGVLQQHYTETRLDAYFDNNDGIKIDNKKLPRSIRKDIQKKVDEKNDEQFAAVRSFLDKKMLEEHYLSAGSGTVEKPNAVQHSVPAWLIFGMFFIMIPLSNVMALERQTNTITRLRLARASASGLIAAKLIPYFLINQLQFVGMLLLGRYLLPEIGVARPHTQRQPCSLRVAVRRRQCRRTRLCAVNQRLRQIHRTRRRPRRRRHHPDGGNRRHYGACTRHARNHAATHLDFPDGMGLKGLSRTAAQPQRTGWNQPLSASTVSVLFCHADRCRIDLPQAVANAG